MKYINNIPPALALEQKNSVRSARPTVATLTELADFLRLLFTHLGQVVCPKHQQILSAHSPHQAAKKIKKIWEGEKGMISVPVHPTLSGLSPAALKKKLIQEGFYRIWWRDARKKNHFPVIHDLGSFQKSLPKKELYCPGSACV